MNRFTLMVFLILTFSCLVSNAHSGRTNKQGCHHDKKAGTYHCH
jgi:hypothetical protein